MTAIGVPLSHAVFNHRPRPVWPFYAPALGIVVVLLATNLSAHVIPGAASAWFGLLAPAAFAGFLLWRSGWVATPSLRTVRASLVLMAASAATFLVALAHRTQIRHAEESWHFPLVLRLARGVFPPVTPYGHDAGIGYHYGPNLLAASIVNTMAVPPWTAIAVLTALLIVALILAAIGFAWDIGAPLPLAVGSGLVLGLILHPIRIGLPPYVSTTQATEGIPGFLAGFATGRGGEAFEWLHKPHWALALCIVILVAAALEAGVGRRQAALIAVAAGVSALAEAAVFVFAGAGLGAIALVRLTSLRGRQRIEFASALPVAAMLAALAGGPLTDVLFQRGVQAGMARIAFEPPVTSLNPFDRTGPALVEVGILLLMPIGALAAYRQRSWALAFLTVAGALGLIEAVFLQSALPGNDARILFLASVTAAFAAVAGTSSLVPRLLDWPRNLAIVAVILLVVFPTVVPRAMAGLILAIDRGFDVGRPVPRGSGYPYVGQSQWRSELDQNWDVYAWMARALPNEARLLTPRPAVTASVAGIASPTSGRRLQVISSSAMPEYEDALRFLQRDDLAEMAITHLHLTDAWESALTPRARQLLQDSTQFKLLVDLRSVSGQRHRVFEVAPGAGVLEINPSSHRYLREMVPSDAGLVAFEGLTPHQSRTLFFNLIDQDDLRASATYFDQRAVRIPHVEPLSEIPAHGLVALLEHVEPTALGLSRDDAIWAGYGMRVYDLAASWSSVWRVGSDFAEQPVPLRQACEVSAAGQLELRLLGEPGTALTAGVAEVELNGVPQVTGLIVRDCQKLAFTAHAPVAPFAQLRPAAPGYVDESQARVAGLGFDGGVDGGLAIVNLWYRNPHGLPLTSGTEFRLYRAGDSGVVPLESDPRESVRWWSAPLTLAVDTQMARIEFDPQRLTVNGNPGVKSSDVESGRSYLLALNVSRFHPESTSLWIQQVIPLVRIEVHDSGVKPQVLSGIVSIEHREVGGPSRWFDYTGIIGWEIDLTPWPEAPDASP
ncbi:MAG: hypothetical protein OXP73_09985 [Chloroflexota bacterium]|nr:hypothetical protein [Chloroflexota bacterium]